MKKKHKMPPFKGRPTPKAEPEDIDQEGNLSPAERARLAADLEAFGAGAGGGVSPIPAALRPSPKSAGVVPNVQNVPNKEVDAIKAAMSAKVTTFAIALPPSAKEEKRQAVAELEGPQGSKMASCLAPLFFSSPAGREVVSETFETMARNAAVGLPLFHGLAPEAFDLASAAYQQAVNSLFTTAPSWPPAAAVNYREEISASGLAARQQEDRHNRTALLALCTRLDVSAEELSLSQLKEAIEAEKWRLGEGLAAGVGTLDLTPDNEASWRAYKEELGLVKRRK